MFKPTQSKTYRQAKKPYGHYVKYGNTELDPLVKEGAKGCFHFYNGHFHLKFNIN